MDSLEPFPSLLLLVKICQYTLPCPASRRRNGRPTHAVPHLAMYIYHPLSCLPCWRGQIYPLYNIVTISGVVSTRRTSLLHASLQCHFKRRRQPLASPQSWEAPELNKYSKIHQRFIHVHQRLREHGTTSTKTSALPVWLRPSSSSSLSASDSKASAASKPRTSPFTFARYYLSH